MYRKYISLYILNDLAAFIIVMIDTGSMDGLVDAS